MAPISGCAQSYFQSERGELLIGGVRVSELASRYGTPLFVYDQAVIEKKWDRLRAALPAEFSIHYSVKANPTQAILKCILAKGAGLEIASGGEFRQAIAAGCAAANIIFAGPGKSEAELELVLSQGIGEIHVESLTEAGRVATIAGSRGVRAPIALRVNPDAEAQGGAMRMGGRPTPFGVDEEALDETIDRLLSWDDLDFRGIHLFAGTQILQPEILIAQYRKGVEIARRIAARMKRPLSTLDFGGGLGIPYFPHEQELDMDAVQASVSSLMHEVRADPLFHGTRFYVEPGRYLVGDSGVYVTQVSDVKTSRDKKFVIVDGGMHHHLAASGNLGQTIKRNFPVALLNKCDSPPAEIVDLVGPLCTPLDVLARGVNLPRAEIGDLVGVFQSGAYARSASPIGFLSHAGPPEVLTEGGTHRLIRRRGHPDDYLRDQCLVADFALAAE
jgi:diaminopimelate decarboxylase